MNAKEKTIEELIQAAMVGDTIRMTVEKSSLGVEVRDRVSPIIGPPAGPDGRPTFQGFEKAADGHWELESATSAKNGPIVEIVVRRIASDI
jgi:hypothetical protein